MLGESVHVSAAILLGLLVALASSQTPTQPMVTVEQGDLFGTTETFQEDEFINVTRDIDVFKGIPYAEPPVGSLRFRDPVERSSWGGEAYNATYYRDTCMQSDGLHKSEDCLYLNIFAPNPKLPGGVPVMVWIHGGAYVSGSGSNVLFHGGALVAVGDVIVVTINYRLGVFGFLTTADEASPGNSGLKDQTLALKWINQNIAAFGGDSERITLFGESAGAGSVSLQILSKKAEGLFNQTILQSGAAFSPWSFYENKNESRKQAFQIGEKVGCSSTDSAALVNCLREQDASTLLATSTQVSFRTSPVVDGDFLEDTPANLYSTGRYNRANVLLGTNADEGTFLLLLDLRFSEYLTTEDAPFIGRETFEEILNEQLIIFYGSSHDQLADAVRMRYIDWSQADNETADYFRTFVETMTDLYFLCPTDRVARFHAQGGDDVFMYQMTHVPTRSVFFLEGNLQPGWTGASHAEDVPFVFGLAFSPGFASAFPLYPDSEKELSVKFMKYWTNFAKTGNPGLETPGTQPASEEDLWPKFTIPELRYKKLNVTMETGRSLKSNVCHFWNTYLVKLQTMLADLDSIEREWRQSYRTWKYTDMADWRNQFNKYKAATGCN